MKDTTKNICKKILTEDKVASVIHNVNRLVRAATNQINKEKCKTDYCLMTGDTVEKIIDKYTTRNAKTALLVDDLGYQVVNRLLHEGVKDITVALTKIPVELFNVIKYLLDNTFPEIKVNLVLYEELKKYMSNLNIDLIISNPPYGPIGASITDEIRQKIIYKEFINLLPANDYKRNKNKDLFNYQSDMEPINKGFEGDATVTTHLAKIHMNKVNSMTINEFTISQCIDTSLNKYFAENILRKLSLSYKDSSGTRPNTWLLDRTLLIGWRDGANRHLPYTKNVETYFWNVLENIDKQQFIEEKNRTRAKEQGTYELCYFTYTFKTAIEKRNICNFIYSDEGFKFISKVFTAENSDGNKELFIDLALPKVDWTRSWTVEEILADYGYTADEIKEVMDDLVNFRGMED